MVKSKRLVDLVLTLGSSPLWIPLLAVLAALVRAKLGLPVLFRQRRPGRDRACFEIAKFRTMTDERDERGILLPDAVRLRAFGRWLRSTSLDELPELLNVLKGEMSLVDAGPRPLSIQSLERYSCCLAEGGIHLLGTDSNNRARRRISSTGTSAFGRR